MSKGFSPVIPGLMAYCQSFAIQKARTFFIEKEQKTHAVFFDNADYPIWVEFMIT